MAILKFTKRFLSLAVLSVLIVVTVLICCGCNKDINKDVDVQTPSLASEIKNVGEGQTAFTFEVEADGEKTEFCVHTDKSTVGEALSDCGLIEGDMGEYGLYVKVVNGITAEYEKDATYWAFYVDGTYANTGVDSTPIKDGEVYSFRKEK